MNETYTNYKSEYLNRLGRDIEGIFYKIDRALQTCLDDYYDACETSNMLEDTMKLFVAIQEFSIAIQHDNERDDAWMARNLITNGMMAREGCFDVGCGECNRECRTEQKMWNDYINTLVKNMEYELERIRYAEKRFNEDSKCFSNIFMNI